MCLFHIKKLLVLVAGHPAHAPCCINFDNSLCRNRSQRISSNASHLNGRNRRYFKLILLPKYWQTRNTFCGTWYLPYSQVDNDRTVPARYGYISTSGL